MVEDRTDPELDKGFIEDPWSWPQWPILPLKKRVGYDINDPKHLGIIIAPDLKEVILTSMFDLGNLDSKEKVQYESIDALVKEWRVD